MVGFSISRSYTDLYELTMGEVRGSLEVKHIAG